MKPHTEDNSPEYRMVGNDVVVESPTYKNNCSEYRKAVITRSDERRSNLINIKKYNEIGATHVATFDKIGSYFINWCRAFRCTPLAMTWNSDIEENNFTDKVYSPFSSHFSLKSTDASHLAYISIVDKYSTDLLEINSAFSFLFLRSFLGNSIGVTIPQFEFIG